MEKFVRKLQKMGSHSYVINIPKEVIQKFGWQERQKLEIILGGQKVKGRELLIKDWKKKKKKIKI
ncbi:MAG: hypothetical protein A3B89_00005 [Candidatus Buchananbacteria bacterium RIFCSPHIGHO2_02_FULL_40_13]|nr:MAG: hypothetical protein A3B89_00005 [Candidatus Buchananbacteria bacterium RIFCSPHIGHO2_02_FULL_40_13]